MSRNCLGCEFAWSNQANEGHVFIFEESVVNTCALLPRWVYYTSTQWDGAAQKLIAIFSLHLIIAKLVDQHSPSSFLSFFLFQIQKDYGIRSRQANIWAHTPVQCQLSSWHWWSIFFAFGTRKCYTTVCISIADYMWSLSQSVCQFGSSFPSVCTKKQVDSTIIYTANFCGWLQVTIN